MGVWCHVFPHVCAVYICFAFPRLCRLSDWAVLGVVWFPRHASARYVDLCELRFFTPSRQTVSILKVTPPSRRTVWRTLLLICPSKWGSWILYIYFLVGRVGVVVYVARVLRVMLICGKALSGCVPVLEITPRNREEQNGRGSWAPAPPHGGGGVGFL